MKVAKVRSGRTCIMLSHFCLELDKCQLYGLGLSENVTVTCPSEYGFCKLFLQKDKKIEKRKVDRQKERMNKWMKERKKE